MLKWEVMVSCLIVKITNKRKILNRSFTIDTGKPEFEIDSLVYQLYNLTDEEMRIINLKSEVSNVWQ